MFAFWGSTNPSRENTFTYTQTWAIKGGWSVLAMAAYRWQSQTWECQSIYYAKLGPQEGVPTYTGKGSLDFVITPVQWNTVSQILFILKPSADIGTITEILQKWKTLSLHQHYEEIRPECGSELEFKACSLKGHILIHVENSPFYCDSRSVSA